MSKFRIKQSNNRLGMFLPTTLIVVAILLVLSTALLSMVMASLKRSSLYSKQISATNVAEAGINYYLWHLSHNPNDYTDGHDDAVLSSDGYYGPFSHDYNDTTGKSVGSFNLYIYPPDTTSTTLRVRSIGKVDGANLEKSILAQLSMPYFSQYLLLSFVDETWIGPDETVNGDVHSNNSLSGIRNEGVVGATSATCIDHYYSPSYGHQEDCIWGNGTFNGSISYPVDALDLADINYTNLKTKANSTGNIYYSETTGPYIGYHLILKENSYDLKRVRTTQSHKGTYPGDQNQSNIPDQIKSESDYLSNQSYPDNGLMFFEDTVWIEGTINNHQVTVTAAKPTETRNDYYKNIYILNNLKYIEHNANTSLGLISQKRIVVSSQAPTNLTLEGAFLTKNDYICWPYYSNVTKDTLNFYGSMAHKGGLIFTWVSLGHIVSGYRTTSYNQDNRLVFDPPPYFPTSGSYQIISWQEDPNF